MIKRIVPVALAMVLMSCGAQSVDVRAVNGPLKAGAQPVDVRIAEGYSQMSLGNVGLALESYRKALRDDPGSVDAMRGLAAAYDKMGRFDLSRRYYEMALAVQPKQQDIYEQLAASLQMQGRPDEAARVKTEIAVREAAPEVSQAVPGSVSVLPPPPAQGVASASADARIASVAVVSLPAPQRGPRLERLSMAEVALLTKPGVMWDARTVNRTARSTTIQFDRKPAPAVTLLNAARVQGLAARTRSYLQGRGFGAVRIGNAPETRQQSVILYSAAERLRAVRLAAQFGFAMQARPHASDGSLTVLLGRDAASDRALRPTA
ncbi:LytR C-terminal domain-containing protein [Sphingomonas jaspsi]|uniref:LytR C-terminal domain-containing protein n=1 Tax=Sphingomonas jaspsi TaxID=392409 RepID=UPI0004AEB0DC|nr:LytR C-terminal domain-containing protein [Sphingomonas jaspsi]